MPSGITPAVRSVVMGAPHGCADAGLQDSNVGNADPGTEQNHQLGRTQVTDMRQDLYLAIGQLVQRQWAERNRRGVRQHEGTAVSGCLRHKRTANRATSAGQRRAALAT